jgi:hypothetical protein
MRDLEFNSWILGRHTGDGSRKTLLMRGVLRLHYAFKEDRQWFWFFDFYSDFSCYWSAIFFDREVTIWIIGSIDNFSFKLLSLRLSATFTKVIDCDLVHLNGIGLKPVELDWACCEGLYAWLV